MIFYVDQVFPCRLVRLSHSALKYVSLNLATNFKEVNVLIIREGLLNKKNKYMYSHNLIIG